VQGASFFARTGCHARLALNSIRGVAHLATIDHEGDISTFLACHDYCPLRIDPQRRAVVFVQMSRETFRRSSFLDQRAILAGPATRFVDVDELFERLPSRPTERPTHFILHGAFCGSTLLARHFEELPHCLILKEPQLLAQIAGLGNNPGAIPGAHALEDWLHAALILLSRSDASDSAVLIKAPDQINWLANRLLDWDRRTKVIFLAAPLRVFLLSALKSQERRDWLRSRARGLRAQLARIPFPEELVADALTDGQLGAALWLLNSFLCSNLLARPDSDRVLAMSSEDLVSRPRETFHDAVEFLGLTRDEEIRRALGAFRPITYYSKEPDARVHFDATTRGAALAEIEKQFGPEVDAGVAWGRRMGADWLPRSPFPVE
jgi:hypothetical protein